MVQLFVLTTRDAMVGRLYDGTSLLFVWPTPMMLYLDHVTIQRCRTCIVLQVYRLYIPVQRCRYIGSMHKMIMHVVHAIGK